MPPTLRAPAFLLSPQKTHVRVQTSTATYVYKSPRNDDNIGTATQALLRLHAHAPRSPIDTSWFLEEDDSETEVGSDDADSRCDDFDDIPEPSSAGGNSSSDCESLFPIFDAPSSATSVATTNIADEETDEKSAENIDEEAVEGRRVSDQVSPFRGCFDEADLDDKRTKNWEADPFYSPFPELPSLVPINNFIRRLSISSTLSTENEEVVQPRSLAERFANITPPLMSEADHHTPTRPPHSLYSTTYTPFHRQKFSHVNEVTAFRRGVQVIRIRAMSKRTPKGHGLLEGSVWVAKTVDRSTYEFQEARDMLKAEVQAYKRISEARKTGKPGFEFIMNLEAVLADATRNYLILAEMKMDLRMWITFHRSESSAEERRLMMAQALVGLATLHSIGIIHRDIKPENLFIDCKGVVKIGDFGCGTVTRAYKPLCSDDYTYEGSGGTWPYMSPEQFDETYGPGHGISADYWGLGIIVLEVERPFYTKSVPFQDHNVYSGWLDLNDRQGFEGMNKYLSKFKISDDAMALVFGLLLADKTKRFGFKEALNHPYFKLESGSTQFDHLFDQNTLRLSASEKSPVADPDYPEELIMNRANGTQLNWINPRGAYCPGPWRL